MKYFTFLLVLVLASENYSVALFPRSLLVSQDLCQPTLYLKHSRSHGVQRECPRAEPVSIVSGDTVDWHQEPGDSCLNHTRIHKFRKQETATDHLQEPTLVLAPLPC